MSILRPKLIIALGLLALAVLAGVGLSMREPKQARANPASGFVQIDGGLYHTCAVTTAGGVKCWGVAVDPDFTGFTDFSRYPSDAPGLTTGITSVSSGLYHTCAVTTSNTVKCIGRHYGTSAVAVPAFGSNVVSVSAGWDYTCAVKTTGAIACYFTDGTALASTGLTSGVTKVAASNGFHTCVLMTGGTVKCWGFNEYGQIGDGTTTPRPTAVTVSGLTNATDISLGVYYSCALTSAGGVKCWGDGFGTTPVDVPGMSSGIAQFSASVEHLCALTTSGGVKCRGSNRYSQLGDNLECGMTCLAPVVPAGLASGVASINTGHEHTCAILINTQARCWGFNGLGSVGDGAEEVRRPVPVIVAESTRKPTPTATPCPGTCPTPTPMPTTAPSELNFAIGIDANGDGQDECRTIGFITSTCNVQIGSVFEVKAYLTGLPPGLADYDAFAVTLASAGVTDTGGYTIAWPECIFRTYYDGHNFFNFSCASFGGLTSIYTGILGRVSLTCGASGTASLVHGNADTLLIGGGQTFYEPPTSTDQLTINCGNLPPTPTFTAGPATTPTPGPVGGQAFEPSTGSGSTSAVGLLLVLGSGAFVVVLVGTLFAHRGWRR